MKLLLAAQGGSSFVVPPPDPDPDPPPPTFGLDDWEAALAALPTGIKWTALGTSITAGSGASSGPNAWVNELQASLVATYGAHFTLTNDGHNNSKVIDFLSGGTYASEVAAIAADTSLVIIEIGVNDCASVVSTSTFQTRLETLIDDVRAVASSASVLVLTMYECDTIATADWEAYRVVLEAAATAKSTAYLDVGPTFFGGSSGTFTAPGTSVVKQGFTVNAYSGTFDLATGDDVRAIVTTVLSSAGLGVIAGSGGYNESSNNVLGKHIFPAAGSSQTACVLYAFPYSAGYTGGGTFTYGPSKLPDGVHPNDLGHDILAADVYAYLTPSALAGYFIAPTGNDTTGDGSIGTPWRTIQKFITVAAAGDTLYCRGGTYTGADIGSIDIYNTKGNSGAWITIRNYPGETPVFAGGGGAPVQYFMRLNDAGAGTGSQYIEVYGLQLSGWMVNNTGCFTMDASGTSRVHHIRLHDISGDMGDNNDSTAHFFYVGSAVSDIEIDHNSVDGNIDVYGLNHNGRGVQVFDHGITGPTTVHIHHNFFHAFTHGVLVDNVAGASGVTIDHNTFMDNYGNVYIVGGGSTLVVTNNTGESGTSFDEYDPLAAIDTDTNNVWGQSVPGQITTAGLLTATSTARNADSTGGDCGWKPYVP